MGGKMKTEAFPRAFWAPGLKGLNAFRRTDGLVVEAGAGLFVPIGNNDRSHRDAALLLGLRKRSAGMAAVMFLDCGHWNVVEAACCRRRAKRILFCDGEDCVTLHRFAWSAHG
jgi:hypothetical protein